MSVAEGYGGVGGGEGVLVVKVKAGGLYIYLYNHELLLVLFVDLWGATGGQASTLGLLKLEICSYLGKGLGCI